MSRSSYRAMWMLGFLACSSAGVFGCGGTVGGEDSDEAVDDALSTRSWILPASVSAEDKYKFYMNVVGQHTDISKIEKYPIVLGLRGVTPGGHLHETTSVNSYDDTFVILQNGRATFAPATTHPTQYATSYSEGRPGGNGEVGLLDPNILYIGTPNGNFQGAPSWYLKSVNKNDDPSSTHVPVAYDMNKNGHYSGTEIAESASRHYYATEVLLHNGPYSVACQIHRPEDTHLFNPLNGKTLYYMVIQAYGHTPPVFTSAVSSPKYEVWRPGSGTWYAVGHDPVHYGEPGDVPVPTDYNHNGTADIALFRPSSGTWYIRGQRAVHFGQSGDIPVPADYNNNGYLQLAVFRPSNGMWYLGGHSADVHYGERGDIPLPGDYNGDGKLDIAVFRPSTGEWFIRGVESVHYGLKGDIPVPADYNGDGKTDIAVFRPSTGEWFIRGVASVHYGLKGDIPVARDFNNDGRANIAVFRPSTGEWWIRGSGVAARWGIKGDVPMGTLNLAQLEAAGMKL